MAKLKMGGKRRPASILDVVLLLLLFTASGQAWAGSRTGEQKAAGESPATTQLP